MKKINRHLVALGLSIGMMCSVNMTASARTYSLDIPGTFIGSLRSTELFEKTTNDTPYVKPDKNTISTYYFLSPTCLSVTTATNVIPISYIEKKDFTWKEGYGGIGTSYCLSAYPNVTGAYDAYNVSGEWSEGFKEKP